MSDDPTLTARPGTSLDARPEPRSGVALIKPEFLLHSTPIAESSNASALNVSAIHPYADGAADDVAEGATTDPRDRKRQKTGKKDKGQNKARTFLTAQDPGPKICRSWEKGECKREKCHFQHGWAGYFATKPKDTRLELDGALRDTPVYVFHGEAVPGGEDEIGQTLDMGTGCPVYRDLGYCPYGFRCRFLGAHIKRSEGGEAGPSRYGGWELTGKKAGKGNRNGELNWGDGETIHRLKTNSYGFPFSKRYLAKVEPDKPFTVTNPRQKIFKHRPEPAVPAADPSANGLLDEEDALNNGSAIENVVDSVASTMANGASGIVHAISSIAGKGTVDGEDEAVDTPLRPEEKRRLHWENGLYLAPLTTVGNLPFRRLCTTYGATITCGEMALAQPIVSGHGEEWALCRRHESEKMFGVQLAGGYPNRMVPAAELVAKEFGDGIDFVDVNLGCPIDLVFNQGAGSALLDSPGRLGKLLVGMNRALGEIPLTVKFRTGVANPRPNAHKLIPRYATEWGISAMTLHGRSRQQRYQKSADWNYIKQCATSLRETLYDAGLAPVPIFGNGDCFSAASYYEEKEKSGVDGIMVARGALIKPWIFTEIAERREWDISAVERLEGIRKFAEFGLSHWGSDTQGVSLTRRFLCEALSFQHRYIPIGLLERLPPRLNERPPAYKGRNELETLLSSPFSGDWVKISEMFLGPMEKGWSFLPKHKSNAYGGEEAQG